MGENKLREAGLKNSLAERHKFLFMTLCIPRISLIFLSPYISERIRAQAVKSIFSPGVHTV